MKRKHRTPQPQAKSSTALPKWSHAQRQAAEGVRAVEEAVEKHIGWCFKRQQQESDFGVDAYVEVILEDGSASSRLLALQIKSGAHYFERRTPRGVWFRDKLEHLNYWLRHTVPVVLVLHDPQSGRILWEKVTEEAVTRTREGWKMVIPHNQRLDESAKEALEKIAQHRPPTYRWCTDRMPADLVEVLEEGSPHFDILPSFLPDRVRLDLYPKKGVEPPAIHCNFQISAAEVEQIQHHWRTGKAVEVPAILREVTNLPLPFLKPGSQAKLVLPTQRSDRAFSVRIVAEGGPEPPPPLVVHLANERQGTCEAVFSNTEDRTCTHKVRFTIDFEHQSGSIKFEFPIWGANVNVALTSVRWRRALARNSRISVRCQQSDLPLCTFMGGVGPGEEIPSDQMEDLLKEACAIQQRLERPLNMPDRALTRDDLIALREVATIVRRGRLELQGCQVTLPVGATTARNALSMLKAEPGDLTVRPHAPFTRRVMDQELVLGPMLLVIHEPELVKEELQEIEALLSQAVDDGATFFMTVRSKIGRVVQHFPDFSHALGPGADRTA